MYVLFTPFNISSEQNKLCASQRRSLCQTGCLCRHHYRFYTRIEFQSHLIPNTVSTDANPTDFFLSYVKGKGHHWTGHEDPGGEYTFYSFFNRDAHEGGQRHDPPALPPGKTRYPLYRALDPIWTGAKNLALYTGIRSPTIQPVASRHTDWAITADFLL